MLNPPYKKILTTSDHGNGDIIYHIQPRTIYDFFNDTHERKVPDYQRPYSWNEKNLNDLLNDFMRIAEEKIDSWFLGPIFTTKTQPNTKLSELLDGQQRLTSIQILLREVSIFYDRHEIKIDTFPKELAGNLIRIIENCQNCLRIKTPNGTFAKFKSEETIEKHFENYIVQFDLVKNKKEYNLAVKNLEETLKKESDQGSKTAENILKRREQIANFLDHSFLLEDTLKGAELFQKFGDAILYDSWIIEVPLLRDELSIQIFESLNNRGKQLTLTDKLRYKTLVHCQNNETRNELKYNWKKIYAGIDYCIESKYFKSDEDFIKVFFNTKKGKSITSEKDIIDWFNVYYLSDEAKIEEKLLHFTGEIILVLEFYNEVLEKSLDSKNEFLELYQKDRKKNIQALLQLVKRIRFSDNARFLLFAIILQSYKNNKKEYKDLIPKELWVLVKTTFVLECLENEKSNIIRNNFLSIVRENKNNWDLIGYYYENQDTFTFKRKTLNEALLNNNNEESKFIIYLFTYMTEYEELVTFADAQYKEEHLEHLFPIKWEEWNDKFFNQTDIDLFLESINIEDYNYLNRDITNQTLSIITEIKNKENLTLNPKDDKKKQKDTILQMIGNKWIWHASSNIKASNKSFNVKVQTYKSQSYIKLPSNHNKLAGIELYNDFDFKDIILRSLKILNSIGEGLPKDWDEFTSSQR